MKKTQIPPKAPPPEMNKVDGIDLPPGWEVEFLHRHCPRCGLDLTQQMPEAEGDEGEAEQVERDADGTGKARVAGDFEVEVEAGLQRMVAPLTEAEKERAQRNEQRWFAGKSGQQPGTGQQEHSEARHHQHFVPVVEGKFGKWMLHAWKFITRSSK